MATLIRSALMQPMPLLATAESHQPSGKQVSATGSFKSAASPASEFQVPPALACDGSEVASVAIAVARGEYDHGGGYSVGHLLRSPKLGMNTHTSYSAAASTCALWASSSPPRRRSLDEGSCDAGWMPAIKNGPRREGTRRVWLRRLYEAGQRAVSSDMVALLSRRW